MTGVARRVAISANRGRLSLAAGTTLYVMSDAALEDPWLADELDAAVLDADAIHHDLCRGAMVPGRSSGPCSCGIPGLLRKLSGLVDVWQPAMDRPQQL